MKKELFIGLGAIAAAGAIIGGIAVYNPFGLDEPADQSASDQEKIEKLWLDELKDPAKYSFCLAESRIETVYSEPIFSGQGLLKHNSKEVLLFDKEKQKLFVMARELNFRYDGSMNTNFGDISINVPVKETGVLTESYGRNEMPIRIDYYGNYISTDPETKKRSWVISDINGEIEATPSRTGCAGVYQLDNSPGRDLLVGGEQILIDRSCQEVDVSGAYDGDFSFSCQAIDARVALEMVEEYKSKEAIDNEKIIDSPAPDFSVEPDASARDEHSGVDSASDDSIGQALGEGEPPRPSADDMRKKLKELGEEIKGDARAPFEE